MHIADFKIGMLGACGIVGGGIPVATGAALSARYRGSDQVSVAFFGDGAANEGSFHESINLGSVLRLPTIFVCENNQYGEFTPADKAMNIQNIADRATSYGIPGVVVNGTDVLEVHRAAVDAVARARAGAGPTLIEAKTHRRGDHAEGEAAFLAGQEYRSAEELKDAHRKDPVALMGLYLLENDLLPEVDLTRLDEQIIDEVTTAVEFARSSPEATLESLFEDTWA